MPKHRGTKKKNQLIIWSMGVTLTMLVLTQYILFNMDFLLSYQKRVNVSDVALKNTRPLWFPALTVCAEPGARPVCYRNPGGQHGPQLPTLNCTAEFIDSGRIVTFFNGSFSTFCNTANAKGDIQSMTPRLDELYLQFWNLSNSKTAPVYVHSPSDRLQDVLEGKKGTGVLVPPGSLVQLQVEKTIDHNPPDQIRWGVTWSNGLFFFDNSSRVDYSTFGVALFYGTQQVTTLTPRHVRLVREHWYKELSMIAFDIVLFLVLCGSAALASYFAFLHCCGDGSHSEDLGMDTLGSPPKGDGHRYQDNSMDVEACQRPIPEYDTTSDDSVATETMGLIQRG